LGEALLIHSNTDVLMFNRVIGLGAIETRIESTLEAAAARFQRLGARRFMIQLAPGPWAHEVAGIAAAHGLYDHNYWIRLVRDASPPASSPSDLTLERVRPRDFATLGATLSAAFGHPPAFAKWNAAIMARDDWQFFGAYDGDVLAGGAGLFVHDGAGYLGFAATRPEFRGRGAQSALIVHRIAFYLNGLQLGPSSAAALFVRRVCPVPFTFIT
jgi:hypothetical protein